VFALAAYYGHDDCVEYARENGCHSTGVHV